MLYPVFTLQKYVPNNYTTWHKYCERAVTPVIYRAQTITLENSVTIYLHFKRPMTNYYIQK